MPCPESNDIHHYRSTTNGHVSLKDAEPIITYSLSVVRKIFAPNAPEMISKWTWSQRRVCTSTRRAIGEFFCDSMGQFPVVSHLVATEVDNDRLDVYSDQDAFWRVLSLEFPPDLDHHLL